MHANTRDIIVRDVEILRQLGEKKAQIASLPIQEEKAQLWRSLNDKKKTRPLVRTRPTVRAYAS